jgi:anti-sigma factor RsiW
VLGELGPAEASRQEAHAAECRACAREAAWLRTEIRALRQPATCTPALSALHRRIERELAPRLQRRGRTRSWLIASTAAAIAALVVVSLPSHRSGATRRAQPSLNEQIASVEEGFRACLVATPGDELSASRTCL